MVLKGAVFPNNGLVTRDDIGNDGGGGVVAVLRTLYSV